jgi:hypothetical protein
MWLTLTNEHPVSTERSIPTKWRKLRRRTAGGSPSRLLKAPNPTKWRKWKTPRIEAVGFYFARGFARLAEKHLGVCH